MTPNEYDAKRAWLLKVLEDACSRGDIYLEYDVKEQLIAVQDEYCRSDDDGDTGDSWSEPTQNLSLKALTNPHAPDLWYQLAILAQDMMLHEDDRLTLSLASDRLKTLSVT